MRFIQFILSLIVIFCLSYATAFTFFYGMCMEDGFILLLSVLFLALTYFSSKMVQIKNNEYLKKLANKAFNFFYDDTEEDNNKTEESNEKINNINIYNDLYNNNVGGD